MKKIFALILFSIISYQPANSTEADHWNYVGLSRLQIEFDQINEDAKGFALETIHTVSESFFLSGKYQHYSISNIDTDRILAGLGGKFNIDALLTPFALLYYVYVDSSTGTLNDSSKYWLANIGLSGVMRSFSYKVGLSRYEGITEGLSNDSGYFVEIFYSLNNNISAGLDLESVDNDDAYNITVRYHF